MIPGIIGVPNVPVAASEIQSDRIPVALQPLCAPGHDPVEQVQQEGETEPPYTVDERPDHHAGRLSTGRNGLAFQRRHDEPCDACKHNRAEQDGRCIVARTATRSSTEGHEIIPQMPPQNADENT
jgi:hypothetical protein